MLFDQFISFVSDALKKPLPGLTAQIQMSSMKRLQELMSSVQSGKTIPSSVLLLLYPIEDEIYIVFIQRPDYKGVHAGQISFPGGKWEPEDEDQVITALRESKEEVGINPETVRILGKLSDLYIPPSRYLVSPYIGYCMTRPDFVKDPNEVKEIIEIKLRDLFSESSYQVTDHKVGLGIRFKAPAFVVNGHTIWGATAMILSEFKAMIKEDL